MSRNIRFLAPALVLVLGLVVAPASARAEPIQVTLRLVPGDVMHYTNTVTTAMRVDGKAARYVYRSGTTLTVEELLEDGSAVVHQVTDAFEVIEGDIDPETMLGREQRFVIRPDGTSAHLDEAGGQTEVDFLSGEFASISAQHANGMEVGQTTERALPLPKIIPGLAGKDAAVKTRLEPLAIELDRPAARVTQTVNLPEFEAAVGPFGAAGTAKVRLDGRSNSAVDLETGWTLHSNLRLAYDVTVPEQQNSDRHEAALRLEVSTVMDDQVFASAPSAGE